MAPYLTSGPSRHVEEPAELPLRASFKALCNIGHAGNCRPSQLVSKSPISAESLVTRQFIHRPHKFSRSLPHLEIFEPMRASHQSIVSAWTLYSCQPLIGSIKHTACAIIPSSCPTASNPSPLLTFTLTKSGSRPAVSAIFFCIAERCGPRRGA